MGPYPCPVVNHRSSEVVVGSTGSAIWRLRDAGCGTVQQMGIVNAQLHSVIAAFCCALLRCTVLRPLCCAAVCRVVGAAWHCAAQHPQHSTAQRNTQRCTVRLGSGRRVRPGAVQRGASGAARRGGACSARFRVATVDAHPHRPPHRTPSQLQCVTSEAVRSGSYPVTVVVDGAGLAQSCCFTYDSDWTPSEPLVMWAISHADLLSCLCIGRRAV